MAEAAVEVDLVGGDGREVHQRISGVRKEYLYKIDQ